MFGHSTRPSLNLVICLACAFRTFGAPADLDQMFCAPLRSETKKIVRPSPPHIGHCCFAPPSVNCSYLPPSLSNQSSDSSMWLCPLRHHWPKLVPRAAKATALPSGDGAE